MQHGWQRILQTAFLARSSFTNMFFNFAGNYLQGGRLPSKTAKVLPKVILGPRQKRMGGIRGLRPQAAVSPWDCNRVWQMNLARLGTAVTSQLNDVPRAKFYMAKLKELGSQMSIREPRPVRAIT